MQGLVPPGFLSDKPCMQQIVRSLANQVIDFALPPRCPACGTIMPEPHRFCLECWKALELLGDPCCACCGLPFAFEGQQGSAAAPALPSRLPMIGCGPRSLMVRLPDRLPSSSNMPGDPGSQRRLAG